MSVSVSGSVNTPLERKSAKIVLKTLDLKPVNNFIEHESQCDISLSRLLYKLQCIMWRHADILYGNVLTYIVF